MPSRILKNIRTGGLGACCVLVCVAPAAADAIVYHNSSYIFGYVVLLESGFPVTIGNSFDTATVISGPTSGSWTLGDSRAITGQGAAASVASSVAGTLTPNRLAGSGSVSSTASAPEGTTVGAESWGRSVFNVSFELPQPSTFTYSGQYAAATDGVFAGLMARLSPLQGPFGSHLPPVFSDEYRAFSGMIDEVTSHSGLLGAGFYNLVLVSDPVYVIAPGESRKSGNFAFDFSVTPVPEPGTLLLIGLGLGGAAARRRYRALSGHTARK